MPYQMIVKRADERSATIAEAVRTSQRSETFHYFQSVPTPLHIVRIDIGTPVYRMENYRTQVAHGTYIRKHGKSEDFFRLGQENQSAQSAQHEILVKLAREGKGESIEPIWNVLESSGQQTETLLISSSGVVVNGNRRLAAMRELYADDPTRYARFSHVGCMVLPATASPVEITEIEVKLQMAPDTRLPYDWVNELLAVRDLMEKYQNKKRVADLLRCKEADIDQKLQTLSEVELYLDERLHKPFEYELVKDAEQHFKDLSKALAKKNGKSKEESRVLGQTLAAYSRDITGRVYNYTAAYGDKSEVVLKGLSDYFHVDSNNGSESHPSVDHDMDLDIDLGNATLGEQGGHDAVLQILADPNRKPEVVEALEQVFDRVRDTANEQTRGQAALKAVSMANTKLGEVDLSQADSSTLKSIEAQLSAIKDRIKVLEAQLAQRGRGVM